MIDNDVDLDERQVSARANMDGRGRLSSSVERRHSNAPASRRRCAELKTVAGLTMLKGVEVVCKQGVHV